jgi:hypothetical protein
MKFSWKEYWAPTPKNIRKIADSVVAATTFSGTMLSLNESVKMGTFIFISGFFAKILSNFFSK